MVEIMRKKRLLVLKLHFITQFWAYYLNVTEEIVTHQTSQHLSAPLLFSFDELVRKLTSFLVWGVQGCCEYSCCNELKHSTLTSTRCFHPESWITGYFLLFGCKLFELAVWENPSSFGNTQTNLSDTNNHATSKITQIDFCSSNHSHR